MALPPASSDRLIEALRKFRRQALHATRLKLLHPVSNERLELEVPPPADFLDLLEALREHAGMRDPK
jgi:23S rRNA pseudouridine1911/1915/1917 synthase